MDSLPFISPRNLIEINDISNVEGKLTVLVVYGRQFFRKFAIYRLPREEKDRFKALWGDPLSPRALGGAYSPPREDGMI